MNCRWQSTFVNIVRIFVLLSVNLLTFSSSVLSSFIHIQIDFIKACRFI